MVVLHVLRGSIGVEGATRAPASICEFLSFIFLICEQKCLRLFLLGLSSSSIFPVTKPNCHLKNSVQLTLISLRNALKIWISLFLNFYLRQHKLIYFRELLWQTQLPLVGLNKFLQTKKHKINNHKNSFLRKAIAIDLISFILLLSLARSSEIIDI